MSPQLIDEEGDNLEMKLSGIEMVKSVEVEIIEKGSRFEIKLEKE